MDAIDEIKFRLKHHFLIGNADLSKIDRSRIQHVANVYQLRANAWFTAYVYSRALNQPEALGYLDKADAFCQQAFDVYKPCQLSVLSQMYLHAVMRQDDRRHELAKHIAIMAFDAEQKEQDSVMTLLTVSLVLNQHIERYLPELEKVEERKSDVELPGSTAAAKAIINRDEAALIESLDTILVAQCKRAGNLRSYICRESNTLICRIAILLCEAARCNGLDVADKLTKRRQKLNLRLGSPADFPDIPRTVKFPIEVDFLTGEVFPKTGKK